LALRATLCCKPFFWSLGYFLTQNTKRCWAPHATLWCKQFFCSLGTSPTVNPKTNKPLHQSFGRRRGESSNGGLQPKLDANLGSHTTPVSPKNVPAYFWRCAQNAIFALKKAILHANKIGKKWNISLYGFLYVKRNTQGTNVTDSNASCPGTGYTAAPDPRPRVENKGEY
jgi:hypothetical protein